MDRIGKILSEFASLVENLDSKNANLRRTRDLLLPRLVSGDVEDWRLNSNLKLGLYIRMIFIQLCADTTNCKGRME